MRRSIYLILLVLSAPWAQSAFAADVYERYGERRWGGRDVMPVDNATYAEECGVCHIAYPPGFLPQRSWERLLSTLDDHFGENAELSEATVEELARYVYGNSAERTNFKYAAMILEDMWENEVPLRITETAFVRTRHAQIPRDRVKGNPQIRSLSNCDGCHTRAKEGSFRKHEISAIWGR